MRGRTLLIIAALAGCGAQATKRPPAPGEAQARPAQAAEAPVVDEFEAVVRVDAAPGGKKFQGVWLERADGERWVVTYRPEAWLRGFADQKVRVTGVTYAPEGQHILATHFRVETLRVVASGGGPLLAVGPERTLSGTFKKVEGGAGTKSEGASWWVFVADGKTFEIEGAPEAPEIREGAATIVARTVEPDMGGAARRGAEGWLWVLAIRGP